MQKFTFTSDVLTAGPVRGGMHCTLNLRYVPAVRSGLALGRSAENLDLSGSIVNNFVAFALS
jgi:hypothetical protein